MCGYHVKPLTDLRVRKKTDANVAVRAKREKAGGKVNGVHEEVINVQVPVTRVWTVVSNLFQALSEARDDLLSLMSSDSFRGLRNSASSSKATAATAKPEEYRNGSPAPAPRSSSAPMEPLRSTYAAATEDKSAEYNHKGNGISYAAAAGEDCAPVAFGMNLDFKRVQRGRSPPANSASLQHNQQQHHHHQQQLPYDPPLGSRPTPAGAATTTMGASSAVTTLARSKAPMIVSRSAHAAGPGLVSDCHSVAACPEGKRVCKAARYADLLRAEANQLRERRLAEEPMSAIGLGKPSWL